MQDKVNDLINKGLIQPSIEDAQIYFDNAYLLQQAITTGNSQQLKIQLANRFKNLHSEFQTLSPSNLAIKYLLIDSNDNN